MVDYYKERCKYYTAIAQSGTTLFIAICVSFMTCLFKGMEPAGKDAKWLDMLLIFHAVAALIVFIGILVVGQAAGKNLGYVYDAEENKLEAERQKFLNQLDRNL